MEITSFPLVPEEITNDDPFKEYNDFEDYIWLEIVKIAA